MALNVQEMQRNSMMRMLNIDNGSESLAPQTWKVLISDKFCKEIGFPLIQVGGLRSAGVTLHLNINSERTPLIDIPAVYFVQPTPENVARIAKDVEKGLYPNVYVNFATTTPRNLLEQLAKEVIESGTAHKVAGIFDRYMSFASLSPTLFTLNLPKAYETVHSVAASDRDIQLHIERVVDGLLSVLATTKSLPIIRCPPGEAAEMVARRLDQRIRELLRSPAGADLFSGAGGNAAAALEPAANQRPLLCILDRDVDLVTMLNHTWTYQAMTQDLLDMRLNTMTVPVADDKDASAPPKPQVYSLEDGDKFWEEHAGDPFPTVAEAVTKAVEEFANTREGMVSSKSSEGSGTQDLAAAFAQMPEMRQKKRCIDMHTNIATALMKEVGARELHRYYEMEDQFSSQSLGTSISQLEQLMQDGQRGTIADKTRALMVLYLTKPSMSAPQVHGLIDALQASNGDASGMKYLQHLASIRNMTAPSLVPAPGAQAAAAPGPAGGAAALVGGALGGLASRIQKGGQGLLAAGMQGLENVLPSRKESVVCQILDSAMDQKPIPATENYLYLDPKAANGEAAPRIRMPFRRAFAFMVGGGNYVEMQSVQDWAQARGRHVVYGSTDLVAPTQFLEELSELGRGQGPR